MVMLWSTQSLERLLSWQFFCRQPPQSKSQKVSPREADVHRLLYTSLNNEHLNGKKKFGKNKKKKILCRLTFVDNRHSDFWENSQSLGRATTVTTWAILLSWNWDGQGLFTQTKPPIPGLITMVTPVLMEQ